MRECSVLGRREGGYGLVRSCRLRADRGATELGWTDGQREQKLGPPHSTDALRMVQRGGNRGQGTYIVWEGMGGG